MPDRPDRDPQFVRRPADADLARHAAARSPEVARLVFASACADRHAVRELHLLEHAVRASDDDSARRLELDAYEAYCDARAIAQEHELDR